MARPLRIEFSGAIYQVTSRGNAREDIYLDDTDRAMFLGVLAEVISRFDWRCHVYCLMGNHYHWLIETPEPNLSKGMRQLNGVYTQRFNRRHGRVGHVFQGRYKAILVERDSYLKELARYGVLNPVRAKRVQHPGDWPWSSYAMTAGKAVSPVWLSTEWLLGQFGPQRERAQNAYVHFVEEGQGLPSSGRISSSRFTWAATTS
jgi:putative transposase